jgi:LuxR family transcriptional regulator, maltose regulon positive regulatory protein
VTDGATVWDGAARGARFARTKFRPGTLPGTLVARPALLDRLTAAAGKRLTSVIASAGSGKSVLLSNWVASRPSGFTAWLSCDEADANPVRFWAGFIEAPRALAPDFGGDAADLLSLENGVTADVTASIANDLAKLPTGFAVIVDDFHVAASAVARSMADLVERWPAETAQLVLASRIDPPVRLHKWRMTGELCELRDHDLYFSLTEARDLLDHFGVELTAADLDLLHERSEGWAAALQMAALALRAANDPVRVARSLDVRHHALAEYFVSEVLEQQPADIAQFMLDTSVLDHLTADAAEAVTGRSDAGAVLHHLDTENLFIVALDDERTTYRYHHLVRRVLHAELRARDRPRELVLQRRSAEWFASTGANRRATRHFLAAHELDQALDLMHEGVVADFMRDPALPPVPDLSTLDPSLVAAAPDRLLGLAADLMLSGDPRRGGEYLDLLARTQPLIAPDSALAIRLATARSVRHGLLGQAEQSVAEAQAARAINERSQVMDEWADGLPLILLRAYLWLENFPAVEHEAGLALATQSLPEPVKLVQVRGAQALAWFEFGDLTRANDAASAAEAEASRLEFSDHFFAVDHLRALAGLALERRDLDAAERLTERALTISERRRPAFEFLSLLDLAAIWATRGQVRDALTTVDAARQVLAGTGSELLARADELEAQLRLSLGDLRSPADLAQALPTTRRTLLQARVAIATDDHERARELLDTLAPAELTPREALVRQLLLTAAALGREDPVAANLLASALQAARREGFVNTVVTVAPQVTTYLVEQPQLGSSDEFMEQVITAALDVRAVHPDATGTAGRLVEPLTPAELRVLRLLPTSTYPQLAASLYISHNTVKTHLRSIFQKLGVNSRSQAIERAVDLRLL